MMKDFKEKAIILTGASSGIGEGVARELDAADIARCVRFMLEQPRHVTIPRLLVLPSEQPM